MNVPLSRRLAAVLCVLMAAISLAATAAAQEPLAKAKALYDAAAYEEALTLLGPVDLPEAQQYKALCMLALGRAQDARGEVESLVTAEPTFEPSANDVPPRFVTLVAEAKKKLLPAIARKTFTEAREEYRTGDKGAALKKFDLVLTLISSPIFKDSPDAEDLKTLASGFIELAKASAPPTPEPKAAEVKAAPAPTPTPVAAATTSPATTSATPSPTAKPSPPSATSKAPASTPAPVPTPVSAPAAAVAQSPAPDQDSPSEVTQPVAVRQPIPPVPSQVAGLGGPTASIRVEIGVDGKVVRASIQQSAHPLYDRLVLQAARDWLYTPATLNGRPVPSEKIVTIQLR
jgi:hypothetical protein